MTQEEREKIFKALETRQVRAICPICKIGRLTLVNGYFKKVLSDDYKSPVIGGRYLPSIILICNNCGFVSQHALGALGLLHNQNSDAETDGK